MRGKTQFQIYNWCYPSSIHDIFTWFQTEFDILGVSITMDNFDKSCGILWKDVRPVKAYHATLGGILRQ